MNLLQLKVFLAMLVGVSIGTFTAVAPQGLGMPLVYAIALPIVAAACGGRLHADRTIDRVSPSSLTGV